MASLDITDLGFIVGIILPVIIDYANKYLPPELCTSNMKHLISIVVCFLVASVASLSELRDLEYATVVTFATKAWLTSQMVFKYVYEDSNLQKKIAKVDR